jgi:hypothetical protein
MTRAGVECHGNKTRLAPKLSSVPGEAGQLLLPRSFFKSILFFPQFVDVIDKHNPV